MANGDDGAVIILKVRITQDVADSLDNFIGTKGATREEVASHYVSVPHGGKRQPKAKPPVKATKKIKKP